MFQFHIVPVVGAQGWLRWPWQWLPTRLPPSSLRPEVRVSATRPFVWPSSPDKPIGTCFLTSTWMTSGLRIRPAASLTRSARICIHASRPRGACVALRRGTGRCIDPGAGVAQPQSWRGRGQRRHQPTTTLGLAVLGMGLATRTRLGYEGRWAEPRPAQARGWSQGVAGGGCLEARGRRLLASTLWPRPACCARPPNGTYAPRLEMVGERNLTPASASELTPGRGGPRLAPAPRGGSAKCASCQPAHSRPAPLSLEWPW